MLGQPYIDLNDMPLPHTSGALKKAVKARLSKYASTYMTFFNIDLVLSYFKLVPKVTFTHNH